MTSLRKVFADDSKKHREIIETVQMKSEECWTIAKVLEWTRGYFESQSNPSSRLDAELLLAHTLNVERIALYLDHHKPMSSSELAKMRSLVKGVRKVNPATTYSDTGSFGR